jgi:hypothetical protein
MATGNVELWDRWIELWNGNLTQAKEIVHPEFEVHRIPMPHIPAELSGRDALVEWVRQTRAFFDGLRFTVEVGPVVDPRVLAQRRSAGPVAATRCDRRCLTTRRQ